MSGQKKMYTYEVKDSARPGRGPVRRSNCGNGPELSSYGCMTMHECFMRGVSVNPDGRCVGYRPIAKDGTAGAYKWYTYKQTARRAKNFGSGLEALGCCPPGEDGMRTLGFYAKNRLEWVVGEQGCYGQNIVPVPMYDTLGAESVAYVVKQVGLRAVCCTKPGLQRILDVSRECDFLTTVIIMDGALGDSERKLIRQYPAVTVMLMQDVEAIGEARPSRKQPSTNGSDVAFFCYTSGTTGNPKGALITHAGLISNMAAGRYRGVELKQTDVHLSYLPLPHIFERLVQLALLTEGASIGFYQGTPLKILEDLQELQPTIFPSVPRLLNRVYDKIIQGVEQAGGLKAYLFRTALAAKVSGLRSGSLTHPLWDFLVFGPLKKRLGFNNIRGIVTGSAPIAGHVLDFLRAAFGCPVLEGYGQTESSCAITQTEKEDYTHGHVGAPIPCCEVVLENVPEMGYLSSDRVHGASKTTGKGGMPCMGRGEICFRGPNVFKGYYKMPKKTAATIDKDGWCHTGDIGLWTTDGKLKIIDRKKNIFKLSQGEYVAAEKIENILARSSFVLQSFVYGDSLKNKLVCIIVPDPETIVPWGEKQGLGGDIKSICASQKAKTMILKDITKQCKAAKLKGFEFPRNLYLFAEQFSVDNKLLTPTFKLKRPQARDFFQSQIDTMYAELEAPTQAKL